MNNTRTIEVNADFVADALYDRFEAVKDRWANAIHEEKIDEFVDFICDCGTCASSASEIIDNWLINWECNTYEEIFRWYCAEDFDWVDFDEENEEHLEAVEDYCNNKWWMYSRDSMEACSY